MKATRDVCQIDKQISRGHVDLNIRMSEHIHKIKDETDKVEHDRLHFENFAAQ